MKNNKYNYLAVIQQNYGAYGWEDVSEYETDSKYRNFEKSGSFYTNKYGKVKERSLIAHDLAEYRLTGYPTRLINRKELNPDYKNITDIINEDTAMYAAHLSRF